MWGSPLLVRVLTYPPAPFPTKEGGVEREAPLSLWERGRGRG